MAFLLCDMRSRRDELDRRIAAFDAAFAAMARTDERARRRTGIPGIGALNATALVAAVGNAATFTKGRDLAAWPPGWGPCPGRRRQEANQSCLGSRSAAVDTCARC